MLIKIIYTNIIAALFMISPSRKNSYVLQQVNGGGSNYATSIPWNTTHKQTRTHHWYTNDLNESPENYPE